MPERITIRGGSKLVWFGREAINACHDELAQRLRAGLAMLRDRCRANLSTPSQGGAAPSAPGEYPHLDTGTLRDSVQVELDERALKGRLYTDSQVGVWLEFGTAGGRVVTARPGTVLSWVDPRTGVRRFAHSVTLGPVAPRPFLRRTVNEGRPALKAMLSYKMRLEGLRRATRSEAVLG